MKKIISVFASLFLLSIIITGCQSDNSEDKKNDLNAKDNTQLKGSVSYISWPNYETVESLLSRVDHVFEGKIVNIFFKVIDMKNAEIAEDSQKGDITNLMLYTIYEIEPQKIYRGTSQEKLYIMIDGGIPGYEEQEQFEEMERAGIFKEGYGIPVVKPSVGFQIGDYRLFLSCSTTSNVEYMVIPNTHQCSFKIGTGDENATEPNYKNIVKYLTDNKETE